MFVVLFYVYVLGCFQFVGNCEQFVGCFYDVFWFVEWYVGFLGFDEEIVQCDVGQFVGLFFLVIVFVVVVYV